MVGRPPAPGVRNRKLGGARTKQPPGPTPDHGPPDGHHGPGPPPRSAGAGVFRADRHGPAEPRVSRHRRAPTFGGRPLKPAGRCILVRSDNLHVSIQLLCAASRSCVSLTSSPPATSAPGFFLNMAPFTLAPSVHNCHCYPSATSTFAPPSVCFFKISVLHFFVDESCFFCGTFVEQPCMGGG